MVKQNEPGNELLCHTCVFGPGGHEELDCLAAKPIMSRGMTNVVVCSCYSDTLTAECKPERMVKGQTHD